MSGNSKEYRRNAARCAELAMVARTPQLRAVFLELSKNWEGLAIDREDAIAKLVESEFIVANVEESLVEVRRLSTKRVPLFVFFVPTHLCPNEYEA
jgi:hypothetical protein